MGDMADAGRAAMSVLRRAKQRAKPGAAGPHSGSTLSPDELDASALVGAAAQTGIRSAARAAPAASPIPIRFIWHVPLGPLLAQSPGSIGQYMVRASRIRGRSRGPLPPHPRFGVPSSGARMNGCLIGRRTRIAQSRYRHQLAQHLPRPRLLLSTSASLPASVQGVHDVNGASPAFAILSELSSDRPDRCLRDRLKPDRRAGKTARRFEAWSGDRGCHAQLCGPSGRRSGPG
jgi:hypothetical protein